MKKALCEFLLMHLDEIKPQLRDASLSLTLSPLPLN